MKTFNRALMLFLVLFVTAASSFAQSGARGGRGSTTNYTLRIASNAPNSRVFINAVAQTGTTPVEIELAAGEYEIVVRATGYRDYTTKVNLSRDLSINARLSPITYQLTVNAIPRGASVFIDGTERGQAPVTLTLQSSRYTLSVREAGHEEYESTVNLNRNLTVNASLKPVNFTLAINSIPRGASVYIDGTSRGQAPVTLTLQSNRYALSVREDGYENYETTVDLDRNATISASLKPLNYSLVINSVPRGASVFIDGSERGRTPLSLTLQSNRYTLSVREQGYENYETAVDLDRNLTVNASMKPILYSFEIRSNVKGAVVFVNGASRGETPANLELQMGSYSIRVAADGYIESTQTVEVNRNGSVNVALQPALATIDFELPESMRNPFVKDPLSLIQLYVDETPITDTELRQMRFQTRPGRHVVWLVTGGILIEGTFVFNAALDYTLQLGTELILLGENQGR